VRSQRRESTSLFGFVRLCWKCSRTRQKLKLEAGSVCVVDLEEACHTYECVVDLEEACHTYDCVVDLEEACHTYDCVVDLECRSDRLSCYTYDCVVLRGMSHI